MIGSNGEQLGIMYSREAQLLANEQGVDLVEIAANANPPVVKIIDWGKYQYQKMKEEAKNRKKAGCKVHVLYSRCIVQSSDGASMAETMSP